jgi:hypothetical protein
MPECKHGLKLGCAYCHTSPPPALRTSKRRPRTERLAEQMNERVGRLKKRLREIRGG